MKTLILPRDKYEMNWVEGNMEWGTVKAPEGLTVQKTVEDMEDGLIEHYTFINNTERDIFTSKKGIAIYTPFSDDYKDSKTCVTNRCHTHIWCGEDISYVMALRMGGEAPHLGLVLLEGALCGYSVERDFAKMSNDRGDFLLHPVPLVLAPGDSYRISWRLFSHQGKDDFYQKIKEYSPKFLAVEAEQYVIFQGEKIQFTVMPVFPFTEEQVQIVREGFTEPIQVVDGQIVVEELAGNTGEYSYDINVAGVHTHLNILVQPVIRKLAERRCRFIVEHQQYHNPESHLDGAYLIYDNEEDHTFYHPANDYNGGRERVCMGILLAKYLQTNGREEFEVSLKQYVRYVERELVDVETGRVCNDYQHDDSYQRLYNYPWFSLLYLELYRLYREKEQLLVAYRIMKSFYEQGGAHFYAIEIPLVRLLNELSEAGCGAERDVLMKHFREHCEFILEKGTDYPAHEVNYEQSIVAPAANLLIQMYQATGEAIYLNGAERQMEVLELFNGRQPDYHMYEVAIRHWDGYWFGKKKLYGDTYPHYWSALTANAYKDWKQITGQTVYGERAEAAYRAVLSLIHEDGRASCAYVYPVTVNGIEADFYDPYANDQDWALYFYLRSGREREDL